MKTEPLFFALIIGLLIAALTTVYLMFSRSKKKSVARRKGRLKKKGTLKICPVCGSSLQEGQRVYSEAFSMEDSKIMHIHGCPYCHEASSPMDRFCPVCKKILEKSDFLVARMRQDKGISRVHVSGCSRCMKVK